MPDTIAQVTHIRCRLVPHDWRFARDEAARIDADWDERRSGKPDMYDGRVLLMRDLALAPGAMACSCFEASYKSFLSFLGWRDQLDDGDTVVNCFGMAALRSADGAFMLGEMSAGTASAGKLYFPAGTPEPADLGADGCVDFEGNVLRELTEETGLRPDEVALEAGWTIVVAGRRVACMKLMRSRATAAELRDRLTGFNSSQRSPELADLVPVKSRADYDGARMPDFMIRYLDWALGRAAA